MHKNARLTPIGRERMVRMMLNGQTPEAAARAAGVCPATARKWLKRYRAEGVAGLQDRSSRPARLRNPTPDETAARIIALRRRRWTGKHIAQEAGVSLATVSRVLKRAGLSRLKDLQPAEPVRRYERENPGDMIHLDIKKLGRFERVGIASPVTAEVSQTRRREKPAAMAGSMCMFASTIIRGCHSAKSTRMRKPSAPSPTSRPPSPGTKSSA